LRAGRPAGPRAARWPCTTPVADTTSRHPPRRPLRLQRRPHPTTQKLAELKAAGIINDEEFEAKKKQILGL
jgi:hypothetical protein